MFRPVIGQRASVSAMPSQLAHARYTRYGVNSRVQMQCSVKVKLLAKIILIDNRIHSKKLEAKPGKLHFSRNTRTHKLNTKIYVITCTKNLNVESTTKLYF